MKMNLNFLKFWREFQNKIKLKKYKFPCVNCFVRPICNLSKKCDKLEIKEDKLTDFFLKYGCCIDCGSKKFYKGPRGGLAINIQCAGCLHWFNNSLPLTIQRIRTP
jgi:hypothetical protein